MRKRKAIQFLTLGILSFISVGIAYFLGKSGVKHFVFIDGAGNFFMKLLVLPFYIAILVFVAGSIYFLRTKNIKALILKLKSKWNTKNILICSLIALTIFGGIYFLGQKDNEKMLYEQSVLTFDSNVENIDDANNAIYQAYVKKDIEAVVYRIKYLEESIEKFRMDGGADAKRIGREYVYKLMLQRYDKTLEEHKMNFEKSTGNKYVKPE